MVRAELLLVPVHVGVPPRHRLHHGLRRLSAGGGRAETKQNRQTSHNAYMFYEKINN
jgi:hypothetical protein